MKKSILVVMALIVLSSCQQQMKTGFVDNGKLINDYQKKKDIESKFKVKIDAFNQKADSIGKAFQLEVQVFQSKANSMSQKAAQDQYQVLSQKKQIQDYQLQAQEQQIQKEGQAKIDSLIKEVRKYVSDYGKNNGYTYILGSNDAGSVMYGKEENNLTQLILDELNKSYKKE